MEKKINGFMKNIILYLLFLSIIFTACEDNNDKMQDEWNISEYSGTYLNYNYTEALIQNFTPGIYQENQIPEELKQLDYGRIEIDFNYNGGALTSFMPILYYGSINKNNNDDATEEPRFHLVVEIGHYNVVPFPIENLFYTVCYERYPVYCRDTDFPVISGEDFTFIIDKRPEGDIIQLKKDDAVVNSFPSAFFPDSAQVFFKDVTIQIEKNKGDSLETVFMVGNGFVGFEKGLHHFNGSVNEVRIYKYTLPETFSGYEFSNVNNQHLENEIVNYYIKDNNFAGEELINMKYDFIPYTFQNGVMKRVDDIQSIEINNIANNKLITSKILKANIGLYKINLETVNTQNEILHKTDKPFEIWIYPKEWEFDY